MAVALIEPLYEINLGHVARVMKNFDLTTLLLVDPKLDPSHARRYASHGVDVLQRAQLLNFASLRRRFDLLIGTTAIPATNSSNVARTTISPSEMVEILEHSSSKACLVMGRDTTGLKREELAQCDMAVRIETGSEYTTLNISHALAILLYKLRKHANRGRLAKTAPASLRSLTLTYCMQLAERSNYPQHKRPLLRDAVRRILGQSNSSPREISLLTGLMRRAILALDRAKRNKG